MCSWPPCYWRQESCDAADGHCAHLSPVSKAVDPQSEVAAPSIVGFNELPVGVEDRSAVLILMHAGMAPAKVRSKAVVLGVPRLCARTFRELSLTSTGQACGCYGDASVQTLDGMQPMLTWRLP